MKDLSKEERAFIRGSKTWYAKSIPNDNPYITIIGTSNEFDIEWYALSGLKVPRLKAFDDSWATLAEFPDLFAKMKEIDNEKVSEEDFAQILIELGIQDVTEYEMPNKFKKYTFLERYNSYIFDEKVECREEKILFDIIKDMSDRSGLGNEWEAIDVETSNEILQKWYDIITKK